MNHKLVLALLLGSLLACATITRAEDAELDDDDEDDEVEERAYLLVRRKGEPPPPVMAAVCPEWLLPRSARLRAPGPPLGPGVAAPVSHSGRPPPLPLPPRRS